MSLEEFRFSSGAAPPDIKTLNFSTDCTQTGLFLKAWFDISEYENTELYNGKSDLGVKAWVPDTLPSNTTEKFFRAALDGEIQDQPTYGDILEWERRLRDDYRRSVEDYLERRSNISDENAKKVRLKSAYFDNVIFKPASLTWCKEDVCRVGFDWDGLGDVNGPGIFINYIILLAIGVFYAVLAIINSIGFKALQKLQKPNGEEEEDEEEEKEGVRRLIPALFNTVKITFTGFCDTAVVFSLALPFAVIYNYASGKPRVFFQKESRLELWVLIYAFSVALWLVRIGALIRRIDRGRFKPHEDQDNTPFLKRSMASSFVLLLAICPNLVAIVLLLAYRKSIYGFEVFWDDLCQYSSLSTEAVIICFSSILGYCILRVSTVLLLRHIWRKALEKKESVSVKRPLDAIAIIFREVKSNRHRRMSNVLAIVDVISFMAANIIIFWYYNMHRQRLSATVYVHSFTKGWSLGQVLSVTSTWPVIIGFFYTLGNELDNKKRKKSKKGAEGTEETAGV